MVRWVIGSILQGLDPLSYFSFQPVLHNWCNKGRGIYYPVCGMVRIKEPLLVIRKSSLCGSSGFPFSLSEWSLSGIDISTILGERERNVLFNDALNTFYLRLYGVRHMVKDHSDNEKGNLLPPLLLINSKGSFICTIPQTG